MHVHNRMMNSPLSTREGCFFRSVSVLYRHQALQFRRASGLNEVDDIFGYHNLIGIRHLLEGEFDLFRRKRVPPGLAWKRQNLMVVD